MLRKTVPILFLLVFLTERAYFYHCRSSFTLITNPSSGMVLESRENRLQVKNKTDNDPFQLWRLRSHCEGTFHISNVGNGFLITLADDNNVTLTTMNSKPNQCWYINSDGSIVNADKNKTFALLVNGNYVQTGEIRENEWNISCVCSRPCCMGANRCC